MSTTTSPTTTLKGGEWLIKESSPFEIYTPEDFSEEQNMVKEMCHQFLLTEVMPVIDRIDKAEPGLMQSLMDKADKYDDKRIFFVLLIVYLFNVLLLLLPIISLFHNYQLLIVNCQLSLFQFWLLLWLLKTIIELIFLFPVAGFFKKRSLLWLFPVIQPFHIVYTVIAGWLGKFGTYQWKNRKVN